MQTAEQRAIIENIAEFQKTAGLSDAAFAKHLPCSATTWSRLKGDIYKGNTDRKVAEVAKAAQAYREAWQKNQTRNSRRRFYEFTDFKAVFSAVRTAQSRGQLAEEDKLIVYCAPSGWGKSHLAAELEERYNARVVTARESWRTSYFSACASIARAVGVRDKFRGAPHAEEELIDYLTNHPCVIVLNEVEFFGRRTLNLIKTILNETTCSVVMLAIPEFFSSIKVLGGLHSAQLLRRCVAVIPAGEITAAQASRFLAEEFEITADLRPACRALAQAANKSPSGGPGYGYKLVARVVESLAEEFDKTAPPASDDVMKAIAVYQQTLSL